MSETDKKPKPQEPEIQPEPINANECAYLITKLDCNIPLEGHQDRNMLAHCINKMQAIVNAAQMPPAVGGKQ